MSDLDALILAQIRHEMPLVSEVDWEEPPAPRTRAGIGNSSGLISLFPMLRLVPGLWLRIGPMTSGSYQKVAKDHGMECTSRFSDDGRLFLYLRAPEEPAPHLEVAS